jgi:peptide/nickel transport system permease protein
VIAVVGASFIAFLFMRMVPGDPARLYLGEFASDEQVAAVRASMGLDNGLAQQYVAYMVDFFRGDWGFSYSTGQSVTSQLGSRLPATIELGIYAFAFALIGAVVLALISTYRYRFFVDRATVGVSYIGLGVPPFWFALLLLLVFYQELDWFPGPIGRLETGAIPPPSITHMYTIDALLAGQWGTFVQALWHLALPSIALGFVTLAFLLRLLRANLFDVSREPFLIVARSKGVGRFTTFRRHALPNAFLPTLTYAGIALGHLLGGSVLVETVFNWPGIGQLISQGILQQDYSVVQVFILLSAFIYVIINLMVDILYGVLDPRVREAGDIQ